MRPFRRSYGKFLILPNWQRCAEKLKLSGNVIIALALRPPKSDYKTAAGFFVTKCSTCLQVLSWVKTLLVRDLIYLLSKSMDWKAGRSLMCFRAGEHCWSVV